MQSPQALIQKSHFRLNAGSTVRDGRNRERSHRTPMPDGTTRHCQSSPAGLFQALIGISKRDPAVTFNRYLTWSYAAARELCRRSKKAVAGVRLAARNAGKYS
jgi:hypothetical protein